MFVWYLFLQLVQRNVMMIAASVVVFLALFVNLRASDDLPQLEVSLNPPSKGKGSQHSSILLKRVEETLNMTCRVTSPLNEALPKYTVLWHVPTMSQNREHRVTRTPGSNSLNLVVHNLQETDTGEYTCEAVRDHEDNIDRKLALTIRINVKNKKTFCGEHMFQCPAGNCIIRRYMCDGKPDCKNGADEAENYCGLHPCGGKLTCPDGRCIPIFWCCDHYLDPNCTIKEKVSCCQQYPKPFLDIDPVFHSDQQRFSDMGFLQTTIYTVVGSAMAFMFVVTVLIIAICRIHLKRHSTMMSRCTNNRVTRTHHHIQQLPLYDIDMCLNRPFVTPNEDITHTPGFLVTYNINNGVQFVGRPVNPPPYCEVVSTPPREGPPPAYISHENLPRATSTPEEENTCDQEEEEEEEENVEVTRPLRSDENNSNDC